MNKPKISIIMSVHNSEKYLSEAIESILNQTFKDFEFIIINDCSNDNSLEIIKKYMKKDKRIILINNLKNLGRAKARNKGLKISKGKYIAILDADDIAHIKRLEIQYKYLENNKKIFLVGSNAYNINENNYVISKTKQITNLKKLKKRLYYRNCIYHSSVMFRNTKKEYYRDKFPYSQDYDFYLCLLTNNKILANIPDILIKYRINPNAISWTKNAKQRLFAEKAKEFYHQRLKYGKDEYEKFNPNEILNIDVETSTNKIVLESEIKASFKLNDFKRVRKFCIKYFNIHGYFNKLLAYYLLSFTSIKFVNFIRKKILICKRIYFISSKFFF